MEKHQFLQKIDNLKGIVDDETVIDLYSSAEEVFDNHEDKINDYKDKINSLKEDRRELNNTITDLEDEIGKLSSSIKLELPPDLDNINTELVFEKLLNNLNRIPIQSLETFINQFIL
jgi:chromosome segregation ATPase